MAAKQITAIEIKGGLHKGRESGGNEKEEERIRDRKGEEERRKVGEKRMWEVEKRLEEGGSEWKKEEYVGKKKRENVWNIIGGRLGDRVEQSKSID